MKTTWKIETIKKTTSEDEYTQITFKDYRGQHIIKLDNPRHFIEDLDKFANYSSLK
jgi:hypothetical protein